MRYRSPNPSVRPSKGLLFAVAFLGAGLIPCAARAVITVTPSEPYTITTAGLVSYAGYRTTSSITNGFVDTPGGFKFLDLASTSTASTDHLVMFDVVSSKSFGSLTTGQDIVVTATVANGGSQVPVPIAYAGSAFCSSGGNSRCQALSGSKYYSAKYSIVGGNETLRIGIFPADICASPLSAVTLSGCTGGLVDEPTSTELTQLTVRLYVSLEDPSNATSTELGRIADSEENKTLTFEFQRAAPTLTCPTDLSAAYTPGDGQISFNGTSLSGGYTAGAGSPVTSVIFLAKKDPGTPPAAPVDATYDSDSELLIARVSTDGNPTITGFENTTNGTDNIYNVSVGVRDRAGVVNETFCSGGGSAYQVQTSDIRGLLAESQCFIATAAFRSGATPEVRLLRRFRDEVLAKSTFGGLLVRAYARYSPPAAEWLLLNPEWRPIALTVLIPFQGWAFLLLNPAYLLVCLGVILVGIFARTRWTRPSALLFLAGLSLTSLWLTGLSFAQDDTSLIEEIKEKQRQEAVPSDGTEKSFIAKKKKELKERAGTRSDDYSLIEEVREAAPRPSPSPTASPLTLEPKIEGGVIKSVKEGKTVPPEAKKGEKFGTAFGFKLWAGGDRAVTASGGAFNATYDSVYGSGYTPDLRFFYEDQLLQSEWLVSLGWFAEAGFGWKKGTGSFEFSPQRPGGGTFGASSSVAFTFVTVPVAAGGVARFNLLRLFRPQIKAAPVVVGYFEDRSDSQGIKRGYSRGLLLEAGMALQIDWLDSRGSWSLYETFKVKQHFLTLDYQRLDATAGDVDLSFHGITLGLLFEI